jgi:metacaspase-1
LPNPWDLMAEESGRKLRGTLRGSLRRSRPAQRKSDVVNVRIPEVLVTGCRDTQTSADAQIGGTFHGALTYNLVETIKVANGKLTYRQLHEGTLKRLRKSRFSQVPQLEGRAARFDQPFLSPVA